MPLAYTSTVTSRSKNQVQVRDVRERTVGEQSDMGMIKANKERPADHGTDSAVSRSCLVQRPRSFIDSLLKAVPDLVHEGLSGVSVFRLLLNDLSQL